MATNEHITSVETTLATFYSDAEHGQRCILNAAGSAWDECWAWKNVGATRTIVGAVQGYSTNGTSYAGYYDNFFDDVTTYGVLYPAEYIKRQAGTDDYIRFQDANIQLALTNVVGLTLAESGGVVNANFSGLVGVKKTPAYAIDIFNNTDGEFLRAFGSNADGVRMSLRADDTNSACAVLAYDDNDGGTGAYTTLVLGTTYGNRASAIQVAPQKFTAGYCCATLPTSTSSSPQWWVGNMGYIAGTNAVGTNRRIGLTHGATTDDGSSYLSMAADYALLYTLDSATEGHKWYISQLPSAAAEAIVWTEIMQANSVGLGINCTPSSSKLSISIGDIDAITSSFVHMIETGTSHGMTNILPTNVIGSLETLDLCDSSNGSGLRVVGIGDSSLTETPSLSLIGFASVAPDSSARTVISIDGAVKDGTASQAVANGVNVLAIKNNGTIKQRMTGNGDWYFGGGLIANAATTGAAGGSTPGAATAVTVAGKNLVTLTPTYTGNSYYSFTGGVAGQIVYVMHGNGDDEEILILSGVSDSIYGWLDSGYGILVCIFDGTYWRFNEATSRP